MFAAALTPGDVADVSMAAPPPETAAPCRRPIGDLARDADSLRRRLDARRARAVIPSTTSRTVPYAPDRRACARRNPIERPIGRLKDRRRVATRYDRPARNRLAALATVAVVAGWT